MSSIPLGVNHVPIKRALTTTATAIFVPFTTQELFMSGESLYYGLNALSNNMIMVDRKKLKNPNGLILGTPGSGKSFSAKREITNAFFVTTDDIIICDPEGEYYPLVHALGGQVIHISPTSKDYINPMDINLDYADDDNPLGFNHEACRGALRAGVRRSPVWGERHQAGARVPDEPRLHCPSARRPRARAAHPPRGRVRAPGD